MNSIALAGLLKRIYPEFDMSKFDDRLCLQKIVYLLQAKGINLGYSFSWYVYGPYSTGLAKGGFQIEDFENVSQIRFADEGVEKEFNSFVQFIEPYKQDPEWLEIASSIHLLKKMYPVKSKEEIIQDVRNKRDELDGKEARIQEIWTTVEGWLI